MKVTYIDDEGNALLVEVPKGTPEYNYDRGAIIGPPDLDALGLEESERKKFQKALVSKQLVNLQLIKGNTSLLTSVIRRTLPNHNTREIVRGIKCIYLKDSQEA